MNWKGPCWLIPKNHYTRTVFLFFFTHLLNLLLVADLCTCTVQYISAPFVHNAFSSDVNILLLRAAKSEPEPAGAGAKGTAGAGVSVSAGAGGGAQGATVSVSTKAAPPKWARHTGTLIEHCPQRWAQDRQAAGGLFPLILTALRLHLYEYILSLSLSSLSHSLHFSFTIWFSCAIQNLQVFNALSSELDASFLPLVL